jgi:hypothetical protein
MVIWRFLGFIYLFWICWAFVGLKCIRVVLGMYVGWALMDLYRLKFSLGKNCIGWHHLPATWQPCQRHVAATWAPRGCHTRATWLPHQRHVAPTPAPRVCHVSDMFLKHRRHVICHIIATSSATSSLQVMWQLNPWCSLSSQILGFGLGSLGFTPIYDDLKMSWITTIHDETVNTSREVICDAQSMTKWNFVIDAILWRKLDDPWWKSAVIDHKVFCSVSWKTE